MTRSTKLLFVIAVGAGTFFYGKRAGWFGKGEVLRYMPASCATARVYIDVRGLVTSSGLSDALKRAYDVSSERGGGKAPDKGDRALAGLKRAGFDPTRDVHQIAVCMDRNSEEYAIGIGGVLGGDVLKKIKQGLDSLEDRTAEWKIESRDGVSYLHDRKWQRGSLSSDRPTIIAQPAPGVLILVPSPDDVSRIKSPQPVSPEWGSGKLVSVSAGAAAPGGGAWTATVGASGSDLIVDMNGDLGNAAMDQRQLDQGKAMMAQVLLGAGFKPLSDAVLASTVTVQNRKLSIHGAVPGKALGDAIVALAQNPMLLGRLTP